MRIRLPGRALGLADTGDGLTAAAFAIELAAAARSIGGEVKIVWLAFDAVPVLPPGLSSACAALATVVSTHAIDAARPRLPAVPALDALALWVGVPAISVFAPDIAILLGTDRAPTSWPAALRSARASFQLELSQNRAGLAQTLASSLNDHGFLPCRKHGVGL